MPCSTKCLMRIQTEVDTQLSHASPRPSPTLSDMGYIQQDVLDALSGIYVLMIPTPAGSMHESSSPADALATLRGQWETERSRTLLSFYIVSRKIVDERDDQKNCTLLNIASCKTVIRVQQGHSSGQAPLDPEGIWHRVTSPDEVGCTVHWTFRKNFDNIIEVGLSYRNERSRGRSYMHFTYYHLEFLALSQGSIQAQVSSRM